MPRPDDATLWPGGNPYPFRRPQLRERGVRRTPDPNDTDEEGRERAAIDSLLFFCLCGVARSGRFDLYDEGVQQWIAC